MLNVSNDYITQMHKAVQVRKISGLIDGSTPFTDEDILQGSLVLTNQCMSNDSFGYGGVYIAELRLTFIKKNLVSRQNWEKKKITIQDGLYIEELDDFEYVPLGEFYVSEANHTMWGVEIVAYDAMSKFDVIYPTLGSIGKPYGLALLACQQCDVPFGMTEQDFNDICLCPNDQLEWYEMYNEATWRDYLHYLGQACNIFFTINRDGELIAGTIPKAYGALVDQPADERTVNERFDDGSFADFTTNYTGIIATNVTGDEDITKLYGNDNGATIDIGVNPFLQTIANDDATNLIAQLSDDISSLGTAISDMGLIIGNIQDQIDDIDQEIHEHPEREAELLPIKHALEAEKLSKQADKATLELQKAQLESEVVRIQQDLLSRTLTLMEARIKVMVDALEQIQYTPASISMLNDPCYELGDTIRYIGGIAGTECDLCVMRFDYTFGQRYKITTFGQNPKADGAKSRAEKSSGSSSGNNPKTIINFAKYINADEISINEGIETEIGHIEFITCKPTEVEAWVEMKMYVSQNGAGEAGILVTYYLDGEEITEYHPIEEWIDKGNVGFTYDGTGLVFSEGSNAGDSYKTVNFHYHIPNINSGNAHLWRVTATGVNGSAVIATGDAHIVLWAQGMLSEDAWKGIISCQDNIPMYDFGLIDLFGTMDDQVVLTVSVPDNLTTETGDPIITEDGNNIVT